MMPPAGLLLVGGEVLDPGQGIRGRLDVALRDGRVAAVGRDLPRDGYERLDVAGRLVLPGLIDQHAHCFIGAWDLGVQTDAICASTGVTTFVDAGSAGAGTFEGMREFVLTRSRVRIFAFLHISAIGLAYLEIGELNHLAYADPEAAAAVARAHRGLILGIKVRQQREIVGDTGAEPLKRALRAAELAGGLRVMVHVTNPAAPLADLLKLLRPGDIVSHFLNGRGDGILDERRQIKAAVREPGKRGVIFDVAHGRNHVNFDVARAAIEQGFFPDTISSDLTLGGARGVVKDLPHTLSKFLNLGMPLEEVVRAATATPARIIGRAGELGTLKPGAVADVAVFDLEQGAFEFEDADRNTLKGDRRLRPFLTIKDGHVWWRR